LYTCGAKSFQAVYVKEVNYKKMTYRFELFNGREICGAWAIFL